jgi:hypothetical protein
VFVDLTKNLRCPKCEEMMALRFIEPERPGFDSRTFECPECFGTKTLVVSISCDADVTNVSPTPAEIPALTSRDLCSRYRR